MNAKEFTEKYYVNRRNTNSVKWDLDKAKGCIPMWIADADFKAPEKVIEKLCEKLQEGSYGYGMLPKDYKKQMIAWNEKISGITYKEEWIRFSKGAIDGLNQIVYALTKEKDAILINDPVYNPFGSTVKLTKRKLVVSPLTRNGVDFGFDFKDIENKIKKNNVKMMILCSPHNPIGRIWTKEELAKLFAITHKYKVLVVSDEVHSELIMPGYKFIPSLSFKKYQNEIITLNAESKTFSLALFSHCHVIIPNKKLRAAFDNYQNTHHCEDANAFNGLSSYYAYKYGEEWLEGFNNTIYENYLYLKENLKDYCDVPELQGSYLLYADFSKSIKEGSANDFLAKKCKICANPGEQFGKGYEKWVRLNLATSLSTVKKVCNSIKKQLKDTK